MKQYFIDTSGSMDNAKIISALNTIGYDCLDRDQVSIHFFKMDCFNELQNFKQYVKDSCREMNDKCIFYTDGLLSKDFLNIFDEVVILK